MFTVSVLGDRGTHGAKIIEGSGKRSILGFPVARLGDRVDCPEHGKNKIITITGGMPFTEGLLTACQTARTECGATLLVSSNQSVVFQDVTSAAGGDAFEMEMEDMTEEEKLDYLAGKFGGGAGGRAAAQSYIRGGEGSSVDPGSEEALDPNLKSTEVGCQGISNATPDSYKLSPRFTVGSLSSQVYQSALRHSIPNTTAKGLPRNQVICNLRYLAINTLEPAVALFSREGYSIKIGSGFRNGTNDSDHNKGSAADLHVFKNGSRLTDRAELTRLGRKVYASVPTTQLLIEWSGGSSAGWIHCANRRSGASSLRVGYSLNGSTILHGFPRYA